MYLYIGRNTTLRLKPRVYSMIQTDLIFNTHAIHCTTIGRKHACHLNIDPNFGVHREMKLQRVMYSECVLCARTCCVEFPDFAFVRAGFSADLAL